MTTTLPMVPERSTAPPGPTCCLVDPGLEREDAQVVAKRFKALSDPTRVEMLSLLLRNDELCVCDLQASFQLSQPTISHHLGILRRAGLVEGDVRGKWCFYRARPDAISELAAVLDMSR